MTDTEKYNKLLISLPDIDDSDEALVRVLEDNKFHTCHIIGNQKGLLKLAKGLISAALTEPARHELTINLPSKSENESSPFGVASVERDERLEYKPRNIDGEQYTYVERDRTVSEKVISIIWKFVLILLLLTLLVGCWTIIKWSINFFSALIS